MNDGPDSPPPSRKGPMIALLVIVALVLAGMWLQQHLRATSIMEDCLLAGRKNCAPVTP